MKTVLQNLDLIKEQIDKGFTLKELSNYHGITSSSIGRALRKANITYNKIGKRVEYKNENFFECIDSEIKAYLLGFFVADGCVDSSAKRIKIGVAEQDIEIIKLFQQILAPSATITITNNQNGAKFRQRQCVIKISSTRLVNDLGKLGIYSRKTFCPISIPSMSEELTWHFIRGYFDGDGNLWYKNRGYRVSRITFCNGDSKILEDIKSFIGHGTIKALPTKSGNKFYHILYIDNNKKVLQILRSMYNGATFKLSRKFEKFLYVNTELNTENKSSVSV